MNLISTSKKTILTNFANLETKAIYVHADGEVDFQFYSQQRIFVEVNKNSGVEILRIKDQDDNKISIQRVRKLNIENAYCVACAKQSMENMALGLSNGQVKLYNYTNAEIVHRFPADNKRTGVLFLDYNASDEYLASVLENGQINILATKSKVKMHNINIDSNSTLARFHPTKRFHLSIASYKGTVSVYDIQAKRKVFNATASHIAPCRDLCTSPGAPNSLISVGYDCHINIFDVRRKSTPIQLNYCYPLSTVAMSDCGTFFCVGNLKGELITYDMRNTDKCLATSNIHNSPVTRIAFVPTNGENISSRFLNIADFQTSQMEREPIIAVNSKVLTPTLPAGATSTETPSRGARDSFCDFISGQVHKRRDKVSARSTLNRDSFNWEALNRNREEVSENFNFSELDNNSAASTSLETNLKCDQSDGRALRDCSNISIKSPQSDKKMVRIKEVQTRADSEDVTSNSDKENPNADLDLSNRLPILQYDRISTPNPVRNSTGNIGIKTKNNVNTPAALTTSNGADVTQHIIDLREDMEKRFKELENEIKFNAEHNKFQIVNQAAHLCIKHTNATDEIRDALAILLQQDPFVTEFLRMRRENELLKKEIEKLTKK